MSARKTGSTGFHIYAHPRGSGKMGVEQQVKSAEITRVPATPSPLPVVTHMTFPSEEERDCSSVRARNRTPLRVSTPKSVSASPRGCAFTPPPNSPSFNRPTKDTGPAIHARRKLTLATDGTRISKQKDLKSGKIVPEGMALFQENKEVKKRCAWITSQSDATYVSYHDEEWGVPVHDDRKLFELLVLAGAQAEITWSTILKNREFYRNSFADFNPAVVASFDKTKMASLQTHDDILLSEARIRSIVNNAKLVLEIVKLFGSLDKYLWGFVNYKPIVNSHRHPNFIPVKTAKSDAISKDLQKRGFRHAGSMVVYSLMQAAGMTNNHLVHCFRHKECKALQEQHQKCERNPRTVQRDQLQTRKPHKPVETSVC